MLLPSNAVVLAEARATALLATASCAVVLADARAAALLASASLAVVLADARATILFAPAPLAGVLVKKIKTPVSPSPSPRVCEDVRSSSFSSSLS